MNRESVIRGGRWWCLSVLFAASMVTGCNDVPVHDVTRSFAVQVKEVVKNQGVIKLDFLWIIDNSSSMSQEQAALAASFDEFRLQLVSYLNIDIRLAVTTTDAMFNRGKFVADPATTFPPAGYESRVWPCLKDKDCVDRFGTNWQCRGSGNAADLYNLNESVNTTCTFRCQNDGQCCNQFCFDDECGGDKTCIQDTCASALDECVFECRQPGMDSSGCLRPPDTKDCPAGLPKVLSMDTIEYFKCLATVKTEQAYGANMEQGLKAAWLALDPSGINAEQSRSFLRPDAYLVVVFVSDEDDCSIHEEYCAPNAPCTKDSDCGESATCKTDYRASQLAGAEKKFCCGTIKKDYYNNCALLGDYRGRVHHECSYDLLCSDCEVDDDCEPGWGCTNVIGATKKCRPLIYSLGNIASYQQPPGSPVHSLKSVAEYYAALRSLKPDPAKVLVAAITGDGLVKPADKDSLISAACLANDKMEYCQTYKLAKAEAAQSCLDDPSLPECRSFHRAKLDCIRQCYVASKANKDKPQIARASHICSSEYGTGDYGARYVQLAHMFGPNGIMSNVCSDEGISPALKTLAETIIRRVTKFCVPRPVKEGMIVVVKRITTAADGSRKEEILRLGELPDGDYMVETPVKECCFPDAKGRCTGTLTAVTFNEILDPSATIEISYESVLGEE